MKKRVLSLFMALALCFSMAPEVSFAEEAGAVTEQEAQNGGSTADGYTTGDETPGDVMTSAAEMSVMAIQTLRYRTQKRMRLCCPFRSR